MAETIVAQIDHDVATTVVGLASLAAGVHMVEQSRISRPRKALALGLGVLLSAGVRMGMYTDEERVAYAPPSDCITTQESGEWLNDEIVIDDILRERRNADKSVVNRVFNTEHSSLLRVFDYIGKVYEMNLRQTETLPNSGLESKLFSNVDARMDHELLDEFWRDTIAPHHFDRRLPGEKFKCHSDNLFRNRMHESSTINFRIAVVDSEQPFTECFVSWGVRPDEVDVRCVTNDITRLNSPGLIAHEVAVHATEMLEDVPILPRLRALENVANEVEEATAQRWQGREFELFSVE